MRIYTYYEDINWQLQEGILKFWKSSWENQGFEAVILNQENAKKSPYYDGFIEQIKIIYERITGKKITPYGLSCYVRWLAYSALEETESFLVSDYDVINKGFKTNHVMESKEKISFLNRYCPCVAYGTQTQFLDFWKDIITLSIENLEKLQKEYLEKKLIFYHDQEFLALNQKNINYNICPVNSYVKLYGHNNLENKDCKLFHMAHRAVRETQLKFPEFENIDRDSLRIKLIKELLI